MMKNLSTSFRQNAFTLIEVMAVLVIMGLIVSMVSLNFSGSNQKELLHKEAKRFTAVFRMAADAALLNNVELGLEINEEKQRYRFLLLDDNDVWQPIADDSVFSDYQLPETFSLSIQLDGLPWVEDESLFEPDSFETEEFTLDEEEEQPPNPQVFVFSSGEVTPFLLSFDYQAEFGDDLPARFNVSGHYDASLKLYEEGDEEP